MPRLKPLASSILYRASKKRLGAENLPAARASKPVQWTGRVDQVTSGPAIEGSQFLPTRTPGSVIRESLTLPLNDSPIFLRFLRAVANLDRLPRCDMQVLAGTEDPIQHPLTAHSATWPLCMGVNGRPLNAAGSGKSIRAAWR
jgi:hypothetical protein